MSLVASALAALFVAAPPQLLSASELEAMHPKIHPKGTEVAWEVQAADTRRLRRYVMAKKKVMPLGPNGVPTRSPSWVTPKKLLTNVLTDAGRWALWVKKKEPASPSAASDIHPALSPDGTRIAFVSGRTGAGDIYLVKSGKTNQPPERITSAPVPELHPRWSPDSTRLLYLRTTRRARELVVMKLGSTDGGTVVAGEGTGPISASWAPTGGSIPFYGRDWGVSTALYTTETGFASPTRLLADVLPQPSGPAWQGDRILVINNKDQVLSIHPEHGVKKLSPGTFGHGELATGVIKGRRAIALTALGLTSSENASVRHRKVYLWFLD